MRNSATIFIAFLSAFISSILLLGNSMISHITYTLFDRDLIIILLIIGLILFPKKIFNAIKMINILSWAMIVSYLIGVLSMEYTTYKFSVPFEGFMITVPLLTSFIYWSQKRDISNLLKHNDRSRINAFRVDLLLISTSFFIAGLLSLITELDNIDARGFWPFQIYLMALYGIIFSWIYSLLGMMIKRYHIKYSSLICMVIILSFLLLNYLPRKIYLYHELKIEPFYFIFATILLLHFFVCLIIFMKENFIKTPMIK